jgi:hypothetical protein
MGDTMANLSPGAFARLTGGAGPLLPIRLAAAASLALAVRQVKRRQQRYGAVSA